MNRSDKITDFLKLKLEYSRQCGAVLDRQLEALDKDDARLLAKCTNEMDEWSARLRDVDRNLSREGFQDSAGTGFLDKFLKVTDSELAELLFQANDASRQNDCRMRRNRDKILSKQSKLANQQEDIPLIPTTDVSFGRVEPRKF